jgi:hypothetical protein
MLGLFLAHTRLVFKLMLALKQVSHVVIVSPNPISELDSPNRDLISN